MPLFTKLRALRAFEKRHLPFLATLEDHDLVHEIGFHQEAGTPLTMKQLYLLDVASVATVQRRLRRLRQQGVVQQVKSSKDGRALELHLSQRALKLLAKYEELLNAA